MKKVIRISDDGLSVKILDTRSADEIMGQDEEFMYNFNIREAREELRHFYALEKELHLEF